MSGALGTVVKFEVLRMVRKKSFWISTLAIPIIAVVVALIVTWSSSTAQSANNQTSLPFEYVDASGLIDPALATKFGGMPANSDAVSRVQSGELDAYIEFPADPATEKTVIAAKETSIVGNPYDGIASALFKASVNKAMVAKIDDPSLSQYLSLPLKTSVTTYANGAPSPGLGSRIPLLLLPLLFFLVLVLLGNQFISTMVEEKEDRISEMLLVTLKAGTLIRGKLIAIAILGAIQIVTVLIGAGIALLISGKASGFDLGAIGAISVDPLRLIIGILILIGGLLFVSSLLVAIGAAVPSAKEGGPFFSVVIVGCIIPIYLISLIIADPGNVIVTVLSYVPPFSILTSLLLNGFGSLPLWHGLLVAAVLIGAGLYMLRIATSVFERGVIQYDRRLGLREVFGLPAKTK